MAGILQKHLAYAKCKMKRVSSSHGCAIALLTCAAFLLAAATPAEAQPTLSLSASPNQVMEGGRVRLTVMLSAALPEGGVVVPLTVTLDSAEGEDFIPVGRIHVARGATSGWTYIDTFQDDDTDDETFTMSINSLNVALMFGGDLKVGSPSSVRVTILDDDRSDDAADPPAPTPDRPGGGGSGSGSGVAAARERGPDSLKLALWTDRVSYNPGEQIRLFRTLTLLQRRVRNRYAVVLFLERVGSGERRYLAPLSGSHALRDQRVDQHGQPAGSFRLGALRPPRERELSWQGPAPLAPGLWQFVMELLPGSESGPPQRLWAKFVVGPGRLLNRRNFVRNVTDELTVEGGRVHYLRDRLVVQYGATLRLEPGALVRAFGPKAEIVVEPGGRIEASGTREAPVVLTCTLPPGERYPGCWAGLRLHGRAPVIGEASGYGGSAAEDSSGWLRHLRVEFAGEAPDGDDAVPALALRGVGSGTQLEHVQARSGAGDGIAFVGGTVGCQHCVASDSGGDGLAWRAGWRGELRQSYVWQGAGLGDAIDGRNLVAGPDRQPRSHPRLSNVTLATAGAPRRSSRAGLRLHAGTALTARQLLVSGFAEAVALGPRSGQLLRDGTSSLSDSIQFDHEPALQLGSDRGVAFRSQDPRLRSANSNPNHDPRPAQLLQAQADPPGEDDYIGAFDKDENWLEEWTVFGLEADYAPQQ